MREVQYLEISANGPFEKSQLVIEGVDEGYYKLIFMHPTNLEELPFVTDVITANANAQQFKDAIQGWYSETFGSSISVTLEKFDVDGLSPEADDTKNETEWFRSVYNITMNRYINGKSVSNVMVMNAGALGNIQFVMPSEVQLSGAPLSGKFQIKCIDGEGYQSMSSEFDHDLSAWWVEHNLQWSCHGLRDKVEVWEDNKFAYPENGRAFWIRYYGLNENVGQAEIMSAEITPLGGDDLEFFSETTHPFNTNLLYEPIPFEMLRAYEE